MCQKSVLGTGDGSLQSPEVEACLMCSSRAKGARKGGTETASGENARR